MKRLISSSIFLFLTFSLLLNAGGCTDNRQTSMFTIKQKQKLIIGSAGANLPLLKKIADAYMEKNKNVTVEIPSSLTNDEAVINLEKGNVDVAFTTLAIEADKKKNLQQTLAAKTIVVIAVNPSVTVSELTKQQVLDIYSGKISNWREVGGTDSKIVVLSTTRGKSTKIGINQLIKGFIDVKQPPDAIMLKDALAINEGIVSIRDSIGFSDIGAIKVDDLKIKPLVIQGIAPTAQNYENGTYPMNKNIYILTQNNPSGLTKEFVNFVLGWEGQKVILDNGYLSAYDSK